MTFFAPWRVRRPFRRTVFLPGSGSAAFSPLSLFAGGVVGAWYDPSDLTTLYQDTAGTTPVTAAGQTVALMLDKSKQTAFETRRNIASNTDIFTSWPQNAGASNTTTTTVNPFGVSTTVAQTSGSTFGGGRYLTLTTTNGATYTSSMYLKSVSGATIVRTGNDKIAGWIDVDLSNGTISAQGAAVTASGVVSVGNGWYRCWCRYVATSAGTSITSYVGSASSTTFIMWGAQVEAGSTLTDYQAIGSSLPTSWLGNHATQATAAARPTYRVDAGGRPYLEFDGVDDWMSTAAINLTSTNVMGLFVGMRRLTDAGVGMALEFSVNCDNNNGTFAFVAPNVGGPYKYQFNSRGNSGAFAIGATINTTTAPVSSVVSGLATISPSNVVLRVNGSDAATNTASQGAGNYGNHQLFIGRRAGSQYPLNANVYGIIMRGAATDASTIACTETWIAAKTGVTL